MADSSDAHPLGALLAQVSDEQGAICVRQLGQHRFLTFGNKVEQSCLNTLSPHRLEHVYTQAMLLGLLLRKQARTALILGLGGGSLVRAIQHARPNLDITAIEARQGVIDMALEWFDLKPDDAHLSLVCSDAEEFLASEDPSRYDLIFADLYQAEGVHAGQNTSDFLALCRQRLNEQGLLLLNQWSSEYRDSLLAREALQSVFGGGIAHLQVQGGNVIAFGFASGLPRLDGKRLFADALALGQALEIPLHTLARNFTRQNRAALRALR